MDSQQTEKTLPADELKRITDFFEILIQIDQREKKKQKGKGYARNNN